MTAAFWDASAVIPLCVHQSRSGPLRRVVGRDGRVAVWWGTPVEVVSALAQLARSALLTPEGQTRALARLQVLRRSWSEVLPTERVRGLAELLPAQHNLRAADAVQLAAALVWARERPRNRLFVCTDRRLAEAAMRTGFSVVPR
jgi:predicted nucleic acid-binding protein